MLLTPHESRLLPLQVNECGTKPSSPPCGALCAPNARNTPLTLYLVPKEKAQASGGVCLDGSPPGYYFASSQSAEKSTSWVLYFKGGGWCYDESSCAARARGQLGSSKHLASEFAFSGPVDSSTAVNPTFADFNRVILWYCDGASFSGDRTEPYHHASTNQTLFFRGSRVLDVLLEELIERHGLLNATELLVSGGSAGGLAAYLHADRIHETLLARGAPLSKVKAAPVSGFFLLHADSSGALKYPNEMQYVVKMQNATSGLNRACVSSQPAADRWRCMFANYSYAHTRMPAFPLQSALDSWQMGNIWLGDSDCAHKNFESCTAAQVDDLNAYAASLVGDMQRTAKSKRPGEGGFVESCLEHVAAQGSSFDKYVINGTTMQQALTAWWDASTDEPASQHWYWPCSLNQAAPHQCNPTC